MKNFFTSVDEWELGIVLAALSRAGLSLDVSSSKRQRTLSVVPSAVVYHMVSNLSVLRDPRILSVVHSYLPSETFTTWPTDTPSPGVLILMMGKNAEIRQWAKAQGLKCKTVPMPPSKFIGPYRVAVEAIACALTPTGSGLSDSHLTATSASFNGSMAGGVASTSATNSVFFASDLVDLWVGLCAVLRFIPHESLISNNHHHVDFRRIVTGHLHDIGPRQ